MINAVGRDIPEEILKLTGKEVFHGNHYYDGYVYKQHGSDTRCVTNLGGSKLVSSIREVLEKCEIKDGMSVSFHHHFREGDYIVNMVMKEIHEMGIKDITVCASSLGKAHDPIVPYIEDGTITNIRSSGVRMRFGVGGLTKPMCDLLINDQVDCLLDTQDFDLDAVASVKNLKHFRISAGQYADPFNKGAVVNKLDFVILAAR